MATRFLLVHSPVWVSKDLSHPVHAHDPEAGPVPVAEAWARPGQILEVHDELVRHFQLHAEPVRDPTRPATPADLEVPSQPPPSEEPEALPPLRTTQAPLPLIRQPRRGRKEPSDA